LNPVPLLSLIATTSLVDLTNQPIEPTNRLRQTLAPIDHCLKIALVLLIPGQRPLKVQTKLLLCCTRLNELSDPTNPDLMPAMAQMTTLSALFNLY
jgi:hypothetical protein